MKPNDRIVCVRAKDPGIPIVEGHVYTVKEFCVARRHFDDVKNKNTHDGLIEELLDEAAVTLVEVNGVFLANRFKPIEIPQ
jgi:hypothetical protein